MKIVVCYLFIFFFSSRRRHTRCGRDWSSDVCSSDLLKNSLILQSVYPNRVAIQLNIYSRMATMDSKANAAERTVEDKLRALFDLQKVVSEIDKIRTLRGELPLEVQDLEDEIEGLETRLQNLEAESKQINDDMLSRKNEIKEAEIGRAHV